MNLDSLGVDYVVQIWAQIWEQIWAQYLFAEDCPKRKKTRERVKVIPFRKRPASCRLW